MNLSKIKLITFDVTGTLLKVRTAPGQQYGEIGAMFGLVADNNDLNRNFKNKLIQMNREHPNYGLKSGLGWENWWRKVTKETFKESRFNLNDDKLDKVAEHLLEMYKTSACWQQCYGVPGLLSYIRKKNIPIGIISNFDPRLKTILTNMKLIDYFKFVINSYEAQVEKPQREIFELALNSSNIKNIKPEECIHVGNHVLLDYKGAKDLNWNAFLISENNYETLKTKYEHLDAAHHFSSAYQLHVNLMKHTGDQLPTPVQEIPTLGDSA